MSLVSEVTRKLTYSKQTQMGVNKRLGWLSGKGLENQAYGCEMDKEVQGAGSEDSPCCDSGGLGPRGGLAV